MKLGSGVTFTLDGADGPRVGTAPRAPEPCTHPRASQPARSIGLVLAAHPAGRHRKRVLNRARSTGLLTCAASAVLMGCSSLTSAPLRVEPAYRLESGHPNPAQGYLAVARQYEGERRTAQALEAYRNAAKAAAADADVQNTVGLALARHGQFAPAVTALRRAVALAPDRAPLLNNLGYALLLDGRADEARAMFRLTLAVDPAHELASRNLAFVEQQQAAAAPSATKPTGPAPDTVALVPSVPLVPLAVPESVPAAQTVATPATLPAIDTSSQPTPSPERIVAVPSAAPVAGDGLADKPALSGRPRLEGVSIEIVNGNGIEGAAGRLRLWLGEQGIKAGRLANLRPYNSTHTQVQYRPGKADEALEVARHMPVGASVGPAPAGSTRADLRIVIGHDVRQSAGCAALAACKPAERLVSTVASRGRDAAEDSPARR